MDITKFKFPELSNLDVAFSVIRTDKDLLTEAEARGFCNRNTKYSDLFRQLFYKGGKIEFKEGLDPEFKKTPHAICVLSWVHSSSGTRRKKRSAH